MPYLTTIAFNVVSLDPIPEDMNLGDIYRETIHGDYSGSYDSTTLLITDEECKELLVSQGSDPEFFYPSEDQ